MATNDRVQAKIAAFAQQLAEEFGEIDEEKRRTMKMRRTRRSSPAWNQVQTWEILHDR